MSVAVKERPISIQFKPRTPARIIKEIKDHYTGYVVENDEETVNWFETDLYKETNARSNPSKTLRTLRSMTGWTLAETGKKIGVSPYRVHDYESGTRQISKEIAKKLAKVFNTSPVVFI